MQQTVVLLGVLALAGAGGAAAAEPVFYGKPDHGAETLGGRRGGRRRAGLQAVGETRRSLASAEAGLPPMLPTNGRIVFPSVVKLYPPTAKPLHLNANLPLRFGRRNEPPIDRTLKSTPNLPQRFGRACAGCTAVDDAAWPAPTPHQRLNVISGAYRYPYRTARRQPVLV